MVNFLYILVAPVIVALHTTTMAGALPVSWTRGIVPANSQLYTRAEPTAPVPAPLSAPGPSLHTNQRTPDDFVREYHSLQQRHSTGFDWAQFSRTANPLRMHDVTWPVLFDPDSYHADLEVFNAFWKYQSDAFWSHQYRNPPECQTGLTSDQYSPGYHLEHYFNVNSQTVIRIITDFHVKFALDIVVEVLKERQAWYDALPPSEKASHPWCVIPKAEAGTQTKTQTKPKPKGKGKKGNLERL